MPETSPANPILHQHYLDLPEAMFAKQQPARSPAAEMLAINDRLLQTMGIDSTWFHSNDGLNMLSGNAGDYPVEPIAMAYSGHQFGHWSGTLGDGRAHMLGQITTPNGRSLDLQLKGSGRTQFSRGGDGRATLGSVIREYLVSEAMAGLGIATTGSIAMFTTGDRVFREQAFPGAVLLRSASSHLRVGSFQYAAANLEQQDVQALADFVIARYFPELTDSPDQYLALISAVTERQASLIAQWMLVGFIHGVMNTDNMSIVGETIDFGPCAFMDEFNPAKVFSSIDHNGRYAWNQQPTIGHWNLARFAETLLPLLHPDPEKAVSLAEERLNSFGSLFQQAFQSGMQRKFGLTRANADFVNHSLTLMSDSNLDFTVFFDQLTQVACGESDSLLLEMFDDLNKVKDWLQQWHALKSVNSVELESMRLANPAVIARNHRVEEAISSALDDHDFAPFQRLCRVLANPYEIDEADRDLQAPPLPEQRVTQTFCGT